MSSAMEQLDCYKVEVLYLVSPHLIWVEVREPAVVFDNNVVKFEQIGIYGMLPIKIVVGKDVVDIQRCEQWRPAAAAKVWEFVKDKEVYFIPIHLERRSSIFDDNIHKFGDLTVKKKNGKMRSLIKVLENDGFATYDVSMFHQHLSLGKINTKLTNTETQDVITELEKYYIRKKVPKNKWEDPIKHQTTVFRASNDIEGALTMTNVAKHNRNMKAILDSKNKDLELCKGADEVSLGRGSTRRHKEKKKNALEQRLELMKNRKAKNESIDSETAAIGTNSLLQEFEDTKIFLEAHSSPYSKKIYSKTDAKKAEILNKVMSKTAKKVSKQEKLLNRLLNESREKSERNRTEDFVEKTLEKLDELISSSVQDSSTIPSHASNQDEILNTGKKNKETNCKLDEKHLLQTVEFSKVAQNEQNKKDNNFESQQEKECVIKTTSNEDKVKMNVSDDENYNHSSTRGKTRERDVKALKFDSQELLIQTKHELKNCSTLPLQKLANPSQITIPESDTSNSERVQTLPIDGKMLASKQITEQMVSNFTGCRHIEMMKNFIKKLKESGIHSEEAFAGLFDCTYQVKQNKFTAEIKEQDDIKLSTINPDIHVTQPSNDMMKKHNANKVKNKVLYGPPGADLRGVPPTVLYDEETEYDEDQTRDVMINLSNTTVDGNHIANEEMVNEPSCSSYAKKAPEIQVKHEKEIKKKRNETKQEKDTSSSSSSMFETRLKLHKEMAKNKRSTSFSSDTTNKDSSNAEEQTPPKNFTKRNVVDDSDDSISDIVEKLGIGYNNHAPNVNKNNTISEFIPSERTVKANPFQNYDGSLSVFVDKLVTPIMMVHSKLNKAFVPTCSFRDIHFTDHIRSVLKNLHIYHPMMLQSISWNAILRGYSVFMIGSTLSGKTMGYLPAVCRHVSDYHHSDAISDSVGPFCIIVCATSHSVAEIERTAKMLLGCDEKVVACHYGYNEVVIATSLLNGCDLLVTTAPSLVRLLQMPNFGVDLQRLVTFVLDDCERISEVYLNEINFCLLKVREMFKSRVNKEVLVQYIVASRIWCDFMESFARKAPDAVVCIGAFQECVLYAKANMTVRSVKNDGKLNRLFEFLKDVDPSKRTVVVCNSDDEVDYLNRSIQTNKYFIFATNSKMTVQDLYNLTMLWKEFREPMVAPVLICRDTNLYHMNIVDASYLVQYSMPSQYSMFCRRFATLNETYPSIFKPDDNRNIKILILLDEHNVEQLPKIIQFVKRCTNNVPEILDDVCAAILAGKDAKKAKNCAPLCTSLMSYGDCPDLYNCVSRHTILKDYDKPKEWMPKSGIVTFKILHYHTAVCYSARLIENIDVRTHKYPSTYSHMSLTMGMHYAKQTNRIALGNTKVGDVCAVALRDNLFCRAQVLKIGDHSGNGTVKNVLVKLIDEEIIEATSESHLYHLPDDFKREETYVAQVRLANIQPRDKDLVFSQLAIDEIKETISVEKNLYMKGKIVLTVGNCIFVDTLEACQDLKSLNETVVFYNVKRELLEKHAEINPDHISKIEKLCRSSGLEVIPAKDKVNECRSKVKVKPENSWAHFEEEMAMVEFGAVKNPDTLFVCLTKFEDCVKKLITDIQKHIVNNTATLEDFEKDDIVLAEYPDDCVYERARIDEIGDKNIICFFVDQGEWHLINKDKIKSISETLITQLPFQAIECRLVGIQPPGDQWTDFATNWLFDRCSESVSGASKQLYVKYYTKELSQYTGGHKYGVAVIDTYGEEDIVLNQLMIDLNLAKEVNDEVKYLEIGKIQQDSITTCKEIEEDDESWEEVSKLSSNSDSTAKYAIIPQPIRSVPLVETYEDSDDLEKWNINMTEDIAGMFKPFIEAPTQHTKINVPAIESNKDEMIEEIDSLSKNLNNGTSQLDQVKINPDSSRELDSDDLSLPETSPSASETLEKGKGSIPLNEYQMRKPKLNWRQTRTSVTIKIQLIGADNYNMQLHDRALSFAATVNETQYAFEFELYGVIDKETVEHSNKGQYILVKLNKIMHKNWLTLTKDGGIRKWIVYDVDSIDTSSDEEEVQKDNLYNFVKNMDSNTDSDSDDEVTYRAADDVNFKYKKYE